MKQNRKCEMENRKCEMENTKYEMENRIRKDIKLQIRCTLRGIKKKKNTLPDLVRETVENQNKKILKTATEKDRQDTMGYDGTPWT